MNWTSAETDSDIVLPNLREGSYQMTCQLVSNQIPISPPRKVRFEIAPPWYRSAFAYISYFTLGMAFFYFVVKWMLHRTRRHNKLLSRLVDERTHKLEETMEKLSRETRHAATLAERDRLAGEIHDSVQQGLTGLMIHLDGIMRSPQMCEELRFSLGTAKKMLDYTRQEVQHALLDMESPFLVDSDIETALRRIADLIPSNSTLISIKTSGKPFSMSSSQAHHLMRICQEAMTNAVRHGTAKHIALELNYSDTTLNISICDDGIGFDPESQLDQTRHFGLRGMKNRAKSIGCKLHIESHAGKGTTVSLWIPIHNPLTSD